MAIFLIRHGETASNAARIVQTPETPLSEHGLAQAARLAQRLAEAGITAILSSDLPRARMTADRLAAATAAPLALDAGLQERNFGDVRGQPYATLSVDLFAADYAPPNGETWDAFHARVDDVWTRVVGAAHATGGHLAVVTHGLVCRAVAERQLGISVEPGRAPWRNTSVTIIDGPPWQAQLLNCTAHLDE
ncbi:MAG: histidine phosphatase family protein [bacterium]